jgi:molybdopterin converting factor small subunit
MTSSSVAPATRSLTVLLFASAQDAVGGLSSLSLTLPSSSSTLLHLAELLAQKYPALGRVLRSSSWAVNEVMVGEEEVEGFELKEGDVVAVLPPVSGG